MYLFILLCIAVFICVFVSCLLVAYHVLRWWFGIKHNQVHPLSEHGVKKRTVAFFHPYCNAGGGGERVLWCALRAVQNHCPDVECVVFTGDKDVTEDEILRRVKKTFDIKLPKPVKFIFLKNRYLVEASLYPYATLLGQSLGSIILGFEAITKFVPTIYLDTMGYAFTMPLFKYLGQCKVGCYVHYPTISTDMLSLVADQKPSFNNSRFISENPLLSRCKLIYYRLFAAAYEICGRSADIIMVNSTWTSNHIKQLWRQPAKTFTVYPPCDVDTFRSLQLAPPLDSDVTLLSIAQFRPEKNHPLQLKALQLFLKKLPPEKRARTKLILVGSCRNEEDEARVKNIVKLAKSLKIEHNVKFMLNVSFDELKEILKMATVGLHTMWNEHFGIGIVECMAAGLVVLAHDSGGPKLDIVVEHEGKPTGFLATTAEQYANMLNHIVTLPLNELSTLRDNARQSVQKFSEEEFATRFTFATASLIPRQTIL